MPNGDKNRHHAQTKNKGCDKRHQAHESTNQLKLVGDEKILQLRESDGIRIDEDETPAR